MNSKTEFIFSLKYSFLQSAPFIFLYIHYYHLFLLPVNTKAINIRTDRTFLPIEKHILTRNIHNLLRL